MQDRARRTHRLAHVEHRRQHFVLDLDQVERVLGDVRVGGGDGGDGVAVVQRPCRRPGRCSTSSRRLAGPRPARRRGRRAVGQVGGGDDGLDARQRHGLRGVDALDDGVGVRAALDRPYSMPVRWMSAPYWARPVTLSMPSCRMGRVPMTLYCGLSVVTMLVAPVRIRCGNHDGTLGRRLKAEPDSTQRREVRRGSSSRGGGRYLPLAEARSAITHGTAWSLASTIWLAWYTS